MKKQTAICIALFPLLLDSSAAMAIYAENNSATANKVTVTQKFLLAAENANKILPNQQQPNTQLAYVGKRGRGYGYTYGHYKYRPRPFYGPAYRPVYGPAYRPGVYRWP